MEYASGGELFERICNSGRFSEDEVFIRFVSIMQSFLFTFADMSGYFFLFRLASFSNNLYLGSVTVMQWYVKFSFWLF